MTAQKQSKLQNRQNLQETGSRIDFRNSALLSDKKICPRSERVLLFTSVHIIIMWNPLHLFPLPSKLEVSFKNNE